MRKVALVGFGAIGESVARGLLRRSDAFLLGAVCVRPARAAACRAAMPQHVRVTSDIRQMLATQPDIVIEAAGQEAVAAVGGPALVEGCDLYVLSVGALADAAVHARLTQQARQGGGQIMIPCGALAGFDGLLALRESGLQSVRYTSIKPPAAWRGTALESQQDLGALTQPVTFFEGTARAAALRFPRNANLAAAVALAGLGFDATRVHLVADPNTPFNTGRLVAEATAARLELSVSGAGFDANPKTSQITAMSVLAALDNAATAIRFV